MCLLHKVCNLSVQWLDIEQMSLATELDIRIPVSCLPGVMPVLAQTPQAICRVALFDILFAWYFCYVFYPAWAD